ncbi:hypothetical protein QVD17_22659 [Tagetes erecta]|uniref:RRM domain-containing protein n=1 Tax=Tagetes erecta TaxID=13708 RepID=A0AAD8KDL6_TARER|nr:hypothetical protein QVD17_22659 [Tagetes erecta]
MEARAGERAGDRRKEHSNGHLEAELQRNHGGTGRNLEEGWNTYKGKHTRKLEPKSRKVWRPKIPTTSLFISNLPEDIKEETLYRKFAGYGDLHSVCIPWKRDKSGNFFGFVRYTNVDDKQAFVEKFVNITVNGAKLGVNIAKHDRMAFENPSFQQHQATKPHQHPQRKPRTWPPLHNPVKTGGAQSFKDALLNKFTSRTIIISPKEADKKQRWTDNSFIADSKNIESLCKCEEICRSMGLKEFTVYYLGGLSSLITLKDSSEVDDLLHKKELWKPYWQSVLRWHEEYTQKDRIAWLTIRGVPAVLWEEETFDLIGNIFGKVVHKMPSSQIYGFLHYDMVGILTTKLDSIKELVNIRWKNKSFKIWVEEESNMWHPHQLAGTPAMATMANNRLTENFVLKSCINASSKTPPEDNHISCDMECETTFEGGQPKSSSHVVSTPYTSSSHNAPIITSPLVGPHKNVSFNFRKRQRCTSPPHLPSFINANLATHPAHPDPTSSSGPSTNPQTNLLPPPNPKYNPHKPISQNQPITPLTPNVIIGQTTPPPFITPSTSPNPPSGNQTTRINRSHTRPKSKTSKHYHKQTSASNQQPPLNNVHKQQSTSPSLFPVEFTSNHDPQTTNSATFNTSAKIITPSCVPESTEPHFLSSQSTIANVSASPAADEIESNSQDPDSIREEVRATMEINRIAGIELQNHKYLVTKVILGEESDAGHQ